MCYRILNLLVTPGLCSRHTEKHRVQTQVEAAWLAWSEAPWSNYRCLGMRTPSTIFSYQNDDTIALDSSSRDPDRNCICASQGSQFYNQNSTEKTFQTILLRHHDILMLCGTELLRDWQAEVRRCASRVPASVWPPPMQSCLTGNGDLVHWIPVWNGHGKTYQKARLCVDAIPKSWEYGRLHYRPCYIVYVCYSTRSFDSSHTWKMCKNPVENPWVVVIIYSNG